LQPPRDFVVVTAAEHGSPSALVEAAGETLLAAFLVDEGRLAALLAEIPNAAPAPASRRRGGRRLAALDADVRPHGASHGRGQGGAGWGSGRAFAAPEAVGGPPPMRESWLMTSSRRRWAESGDGSLSTSEISRPRASATAMVSEPALPTWTNTSKGSPPGVSLTVMKAVPIGVSIPH